MLNTTVCELCAMIESTALRYRFAGGGCASRDTEPSVRWSFRDILRQLVLHAHDGRLLLEEEVGSSASARGDPAFRRCADRGSVPSVEASLDRERRHRRSTS